MLSVEWRLKQAAWLVQLLGAAAATATCVARVRKEWARRLVQISLNDVDSGCNKTIAFTSFFSFLGPHVAMTQCANQDTAKHNTYEDLNTQLNLTSPSLSYKQGHTLQ